MTLYHPTGSFCRALILICAQHSNSIQAATTPDSEVEWVEFTAQYRWPLILASLVISWVGCWSTIELLLRRTGNTGFLNLALLVSAAFCFGSVSAFSMHFIGNHALRLVDPQNHMTKDLKYNVLFTLMSLVTSISSMVIAFSVIGLKLPTFQWFTHRDHTKDSNSKKILSIDSQISEKSNNPVDYLPPRLLKDGRFENTAETPTLTGHGLNPKATHRDFTGFCIRSFISGIICGSGVCGMHFISQAGIVNERLTKYNMPLIFLSVLLSYCVSWFAFWILFVKLAPQLRQTWYNRLGVAGILTLAVGSMHYVAMLATSYYREEGKPETNTDSSQSNAVQAVIEAIVNIFAPLCCLIIVISSIHYTRVRRKAQALRQRILIAACVFDEHGNVLTTADGQLPVRELKLDDELPFTSSKMSIGEWILGRKYTNCHQDLISTQHPAFLQCMRRSWDMKCEKRSWLGSLKSVERNPPCVKPRSLDPQTPRSPFSSGSPFVTPKITSIGFGAEQTVVVNLVNNSEVLQTATMRFVDAFFQTWNETVAKFLAPSNLSLAPQAVLYDQILEIGHETIVSSRTQDAVRGNGQMMFMVYQTRNRSASAKYEEQGYRFNDTYHVSKVFASDMAISPSVASDTLRDLRRFHQAGTSTGLAESVVYCGLCVAQALPYDGLQILVDPARRHSIPMLPILQLPHSSPKDRDLSLLPTAELELLRVLMKRVGSLKHEDIVASNAAEAQSGCPSRITALVTSAASALCNALLPKRVASGLLKNLRLYPHLILLNPANPASGPSMPSYLMCFRGVVSPEIEIPKSDSWSPFESYCIQSEGVSQAHGDLQRPGNSPIRSLSSNVVSPVSTLRTPHSALQRANTVQGSPAAYSADNGDINLASIIQDINAEFILREAIESSSTRLRHSPREEELLPWTHHMALEILMKSPIVSP
ncbi:hypothetical protein CROQUDRAFT_667720 [Cronartium quercuum f. sp. fusiforme G11]|uniref:MHYT domain-containing protein n=1 Tax=Cronartium quercuum f. sp. fusiforme G11 TaxID=708437 RepID=A0A9P6NWY1_9BASI|nr:hypothetical protein CROQUDRAFT_667720 [Cronartium quercuum f. sp. fusiforme G11]